MSMRGLLVGDFGRNYQKYRDQFKAEYDIVLGAHWVTGTPVKDIRDRPLPKGCEVVIVFLETVRTLLNDVRKKANDANVPYVLLRKKHTLWAAAFKERGILPVSERPPVVTESTPVKPSIRATLYEAPPAEEPQPTPVPTPTKDTVEEYVELFWDDQCNVPPLRSMAFRDVYDIYAKWCMGEKFPVADRSQLRQALVKLGIKNPTDDIWFIDTKPYPKTEPKVEPKKPPRPICHLPAIPPKKPDEAKLRLQMEEFIRTHPGCEQWMWDKTDSPYKIEKSAGVIGQRILAEFLATKLVTKKRMSRGTLGGCCYCYFHKETPPPHIPWRERVNVTQTTAASPPPAPAVLPPPSPQEDDMGGKCFVPAAYEAGVLAYVAAHPGCSPTHWCRVGGSVPAAQSKHAWIYLAAMEKKGKILIRKSKRGRVWRCYPVHGYFKDNEGEVHALPPRATTPPPPPPPPVTPPTPWRTPVTTLPVVDAFVETQRRAENLAEVELRRKVSRLRHLQEINAISADEFAAALAHIFDSK